MDTGCCVAEVAVGWLLLAEGGKLVNTVEAEVDKAEPGMCVSDWRQYICVWTKVIHSNSPAPGVDWVADLIAVNCGDGLPEGVEATRQ